jgi:hypothetical protein
MTFNSMPQSINFALIVLLASSYYCPSSVPKQVRIVDLYCLFLIDIVSKTALTSLWEFISSIRSIFLIQTFHAQLLDELPQKLMSSALVPY